MNQNIDDFREWDDCALVTRQISRRLLERGYPGDLDIRWRLSCCQGDGVCFYGTLDSGALPQLLGRLLADDKKALSVLLPLAEDGELVVELTQPRQKPGPLWNVWHNILTPVSALTGTRWNVR